MKQQLPTNDHGRAEMCRLVIAQAAIDIAAGRPYVSQETIDALTAFLPTFDAAIAAYEDAIQARAQAVVASRAADTRIKNTIRGIWHETNRRVAHENYPETVRLFYSLPLSGRYPRVNPTDWLPLAQSIIRGDADAVAAGYSAVVGPSAAELQNAYQVAWDAAMDKMSAKGEATHCQNTLRTLRPQANDLCLQVRDELMFNLRRLHANEAQAIMAQYGIRFVSSGETPEELPEAVPTV